MLKIYNSLARDKQEFKPIEVNKVRMYVCGMTVYDYCHLGHARVMVVFDMVQRWLKASGYAVTYVRNITDIDDKIIKRAAENKESIHQLTQRFIAAMHEDADALGVQRPDHEPRATQYVPQMLAMIEQLEKNGLAYQAADGDVNYAVRKFDGYGKLSGKSLEDLRAGERVEVDGNKHDPLDFVLWKHAKEAEAEEVKWDSKWGKGRPGWHIECSAMSSELLGEHFDIHGGGADLQFPHHENEIAQSEGAHQCRFVNYWMHNGFVRVDNEKMSKSLGNFFTIREVLQKYDAEVVRFFILRAHYRSPLNYSDAHLDDAKGALTRLYTALKNIPGSDEYDFTAGVRVSKEGLFIGNHGPYWADSNLVQRFAEAMDDDFNTPEAIAILFEISNTANKEKSKSMAGLLKALGAVLGLLQRNPVEFLQGKSKGIGKTLDGIKGYFSIGVVSGGGVDEAITRDGKYSEQLIEDLIAERTAAKKARNFAEADRIRKELLEAGIVLEDTPQGTTWRRT
jgi:cysteinyl-tRNA synthetase